MFRRSKTALGSYTTPFGTALFRIERHAESAKHSLHVRGSTLTLRWLFQKEQVKDGQQKLLIVPPDQHATEVGVTTLHAEMVKTWNQRLAQEPGGGSARSTDPQLPHGRHGFPLKSLGDHGIAWTERTWNVMHGCSPCSPGCKRCYACKMAARQKGMGSPGYENGFAVTTRLDRLHEPLTWKKPTLVFVASMGDLFHKDVPDWFIARTFAAMAACPQHRFQVLTKRADRMAAMALTWPENVWAGVSVENADYLHRVNLLRQVPAAVRWLSVEPLLGELPGLELTGIDWAVVGGESGPGARPMAIDWVRGIRDLCLSCRTAFFFKQWGGRRKKAAGRMLDGVTWDEMPQDYGHWKSLFTSTAPAPKPGT